MKAHPTDPIILTVTVVGNSLGVLLPKEAASRLEVQKGDKLFLTNKKKMGGSPWDL